MLNITALNAEEEFGETYQDGLDVMTEPQISVHSLTSPNMIAYGKYSSYFAMSIFVLPNQFM